MNEQRSRAVPLSPCRVYEGFRLVVEMVRDHYPPIGHVTGLSGTQLLFPRRPSFSTRRALRAAYHPRGWEPGSAAARRCRQLMRRRASEAPL